MEQLQISAMPRQRQAKGDNRRLRRDGQVPAVIYGGPGEPRSIAINHHELEMLLRGARHTNAVLDLAIDGGHEQTLIRDIQRHPVTGMLVHVDFLRVDLEKEVQVEVVLHVVGTDPAGVKNGGILEHVQRTVEVRCTPLNMPKFLEADLSNLDLNQSFHVSDLKLPEGVTVVDDPETALFTILPPKAEAEEAAPGAAPAAGAAEPEVIAKKKTEE
jgi:large subunit ribosomal protein L25